MLLVVACAPHARRGGIFTLRILSSMPSCPSHTRPLVSPPAAVLPAATAVGQPGWGLQGPLSHSHPTYRRSPNPAVSKVGSSM